MRTVVENQNRPIYFSEIDPHETFLQLGVRSHDFHPQKEGNRPGKNQLNTMAVVLVFLRKGASSNFQFHYKIQFP